MFDLGVVPAGCDLRVTLELRNDGEAERTVTKLIPSCSCTTARLESPRLAPGEVRPVPVQVSAPLSAGPQSSDIFVSAASGPARIVRLRYRTEGEPDPAQVVRDEPLVVRL